MPTGMQAWPAFQEMRSTRWETRSTDKGTPVPHRKASMRFLILSPPNTRKSASSKDRKNLRGWRQSRSTHTHTHTHARVGTLEDLCCSEESGTHTSPSPTHTRASQHPPQHPRRGRQRAAVVALSAPFATQGSL